MKAIFRHELSSHFKGVTGYVFGAFLLLFTGIYTMGYNIDGAVTNFEFVLGSMSFVFLVIIPILTMRVLAEERKQKTDQLLYSLPISMTEVVLGKYAALLVVMLLPLAVICIYPLILSAYGAVHLPASYCAIFAFFLLGAALLSIGMFISSVTENQAVAAGLCFVVMLLNYFIADIAASVASGAFASYVALVIVIGLVAVILWRMTKNGFAALLLAAAEEATLAVVFMTNRDAFDGLFSQIMQKMSLFEQFYVFVDGMLDLRGVVYFISVIAFFLYLSVQSLEKRRWSE